MEIMDFYHCNFNGIIAEVLSSNLRKTQLSYLHIFFAEQLLNAQLRLH